jgi:hypothetical protein
MKVTVGGESLISGGRTVAREDGGILLLGQPVAPVALSRKDVEELIPFLQRWVQTGHLALVVDEEKYVILNSTGQREFGPFSKLEAALMLVGDEGQTIAHHANGQCNIVRRWACGGWSPP